MKAQYTVPDQKNEKSFEIVENTLSKYSSAIIGITGAGGAGKTTFAQNLVNFFGTEYSLTIDLDDYLLSRIDRGKLEVTGYNPRANKLYLARENIEQLCSGQDIVKPRYDHATGELLPKEKVQARPLIIVEGVTTLYPELRELYTLSVFLDALEETQIKSRIQRDVNTRGYTLEEALALFEAVKPDYERFIEPTKKYATLVFQVDMSYIMHPIRVDL